MGEVLIAGTASLLICIFLSPKFIAFLREREFGQHIREEGPQEHHAKAGTPTMGGIIIFTAISVPFLLLTEFTPRCSASPTTGPRSSSAARWGCAGAPSSPPRSRSRSGCGSWRRAGPTSPTPSTCA
jgi:UDP-N-acetylmuramyl pentapeptide phosphotransferase/UDP-N-acetylglucosamine-1-phosphate transferase